MRYKSKPWFLDGRTPRQHKDVPQAENLRLLECVVQLSTFLLSSTVCFGFNDLSIFLGAVSITLSFSRVREEMNKSAKASMKKINSKLVNTKLELINTAHSPLTLC